MITHSEGPWRPWRRGLLAKKTKYMFRGLKLSVPPQFLCRGEGLEIEFSHQWPMIMRLYKDCQTTMVGEQIKAIGGWPSQTGQSRSLHITSSSTSQLLSYVSLLLTCSWVVPFIKNLITVRIVVSVSSGIRSSELSNFGEGRSRKPPNLQSAEWTAGVWEVHL